MSELREQSIMYSLLAQMHGVNAQIEAMKAENVHRALHDHLSQAHPAEHFYEAQANLEAIANQLNLLSR